MISAYSSGQIWEAWASTVPDALLEQLDELGWERFFLAYCAVGEAISQALEHLISGQYAASAAVGAWSVGSISFRAPAGSGNLLAGAVFRSARGARYVTSADTVASGGVHAAAARSLLRDRAADIDGGTALIFLDGSWSDGVDRAADLTSVQAASDFAGGEDPQLESIGRERGVERLEGESADLYRERVRRLPDVVSPAALKRLARRILRHLRGQLHPTVVLEEHFRSGVAADLDPCDAVTGPEDAKGSPQGYLLPLGGGDSRVWVSILVDPIPETPDGLICDLGATDAHATDALCSAAQAGYSILYRALQQARGGGVGLYLRRRTDWPGDGYGYSPGYGYVYDYGHVEYPSES